MPLPLVPIAIASGISYVLYKRRGRGMTPQRKAVYEEALKSLKDPVKLRGLAAQFEKEGFKKEADLLRKRATLAEMPKDKKIQRKVAFQKFLAHGDPAVVKKAAQMFDAQGATGSAARLYQHASALEQIAKK